MTTTPINAAEDCDGGDLTDNALLLAIGHGDQLAFGLLMQRYLRKMTALAQRITLNKADAEDVAQEGFLRVWTHAHQWDSNGNAKFSTWLHRIVTNLAIDRCRKVKMLPIESAGDPIDPLVNVAEDLEHNDTMRQVHGAMTELPPRQRAAIALCYFDELTGVEAATVMGLSEGAVESLLVRARRSLRKQLKIEG